MTGLAIGDTNSAAHHLGNQGEERPSLERSARRQPERPASSRLRRRLDRLDVGDAGKAQGGGDAAALRLFPPPPPANPPRAPPGSSRVTLLIPGRPDKAAATSSARSVRARTRSPAPRLAGEAGDVVNGLLLPLQQATATRSATRLPSRQGRSCSRRQGPHCRGPVSSQQAAQLNDLARVEAVWLAWSVARRSSASSSTAWAREQHAIAGSRAHSWLITASPTGSSASRARGRTRRFGAHARPGEPGSRPMKWRNSSHPHVAVERGVLRHVADPALDVWCPSRTMLKPSDRGTQAPSLGRRSRPATTRKMGRPHPSRLDEAGRPLPAPVHLEEDAVHSLAVAWTFAQLVPRRRRPRRAASLQPAQRQNPPRLGARSVGQVQVQRSAWSGSIVEFRRLLHRLERVRVVGGEEICLLGRHLPPYPLEG